MAVLDGASGDLGPLRRVLARRFEVVAYDDPVEGLVSLGSVEPDVVVIGDVSPLEARAVVASLKADACDARRQGLARRPGPRRRRGCPVEDATALSHVIERVIRGRLTSPAPSSALHGKPSRR